MWLRAKKVRTAPDPAIIGGSTKKHSSDQLNPVSRRPASKTAAFTANVPATWATHLVAYWAPAARILIGAALVVCMIPGFRVAGPASSLLTPVLRGPPA